MLKLVKFLLTYQFKNFRPNQRDGGFTLIELLVGLILAFLVIIPLLGFVVNMLQTDRQEQAKANSEQEIQAALSYIARDTEQAVYIYDQEGLDAIKQDLPKGNDPNYVPVLVFWKRHFIEKVIPSGNETSCQGNDANCNDAFVYALVAYYLTPSDPTTCAQDNTWSCTAQIRRVLIRDAVKDRDGENPISDDDKAQASPGFQLFPAEDYPTPKTIMENWTSTAGINDPENNPEVLIDYIDKTPIDLTTSPQLCPTSMQLVPSTAPVNGFYACVNADQISAKVFMRGNALARFRNKQNPPPYVESRATYYPRATVQVKGRGLFNVAPTGQ